MSATATATVWPAGGFSYRQNSQDSSIFATHKFRAVDIPGGSGLLSEFARLIEVWHAERGITSSMSEMIACPSYLKIVGMGEKAVPLILDQLEHEGDDPDHWFAALEAITGEDPVPEDAYGDTKKMAAAWLSWAEVDDVQ